MKILSLALLAGTLLAGNGQAAMIFGMLWENVNNVAPVINTDGSIANANILLAQRSADVNFTITSPISMDTRTGGYTIGGFLNSGGAMITGGPLAAMTGNTLNNTLFYFTGMVTLTAGQVFTAAHDDGMQLLIDSTMIINSPQPTTASTVSYTWSGPAGTYPFKLAYAENHGAPAVLNVSLNLSSVSVPEPSQACSSVLLLAGSILCSLARWRQASDRLTAL